LEGLNQAVQDAAGLLESMQDRFAGVVGTAEQRLSSIETHLAHVAEASQSVDERIRRVEHACELADDVESRLASFAEQLADRADAVQEQMTRLVTGIESGEEVTRNLDSVLARASRAPADTKATIDAAQTKLREESETLDRKLDKRSEEALRKQERASGNALAEHERKLREQLDAHRQLLQQACEAIQGQLRTEREQLESTVADTKATIDAAQTKSREESETLDRKLDKRSEEALRKQERASGNALAEHERKLREQLDAHRQLLQQACEAIQGQLRTEREQLESTVADATDALFDDKLKAKVDVAERTWHKLATETLAHFQKEVQTTLSEQQHSLEEAAQSAREQMTQVRQEGTCSVAAAKSAFETEHAAFHAKLRKMIGESANDDTSLAAALVAGQEKVDGLLRSFETLESRRRDMKARTDRLSQETERVLGRTNDLTESMEHARGEVGDLAGRADEARGKLAQVVERGERLVSDVQASQGQIETLQHNVATTLVGVGSACERVNAVRGQVVQCDQTVARLTATHKIAEEVAERLDSFLAASAHEREAVKDLCMEADAKIDRFHSHTAAATSLLERFDRTERSARDAAEKADKTVQDANRTVLEVKEQAARLGSLQQAGDNTASRLDKLAGSCDQLNEAIEISAADAEEKIEQLDSNSAEATHMLKRLSEINETSLKVAERVQTATEEAEKAADVADQAAVEAEEQTTGLSSARQGYEKTAEQLTQQVNATSSSVEAGEGLMKEFFAQSRTIQTVLERLRRRTAAIEESLKQATSKPSEIITTARTQTAQLERVSGVVRKVSGGLARTTLEAKQQLEELRGTSGQARERLTKLTTETERASNTLREWVGEAMRVQARLDKSLKRCPSINETHPGDSLEGISQIARPLPRIANRSALDMRSTTQEPKATDESLQVAARGESEAPKPHTKAEEIAQLIQQAKSVAKHSRT
jgi:chromosome segregation ATPase